MNIQVGNSVDARTVYITQSVLRSCRPLSDLTPGCRITNADPVVFTIIIGYLECSSFLATLRFHAPGNLQELVSGDDPLLKYAKAWHVADMLGMIGLQNKLTAIFRGHYQQCLNNGICLTLSPEPFTYLRDNIGNHTKAEAFLVDFHAGLMQKKLSFKGKDVRLLPNDIANSIRNRWQELSGRVRKDSLHPELTHDRIAAGGAVYNTRKKDATLHSNLQVMSLCSSTGSWTFTPEPSWHNPYCPVPARTDWSTTPMSRNRQRQTKTRSHTELPANQKPTLQPTLTDPFRPKPGPAPRPRAPSLPISPTHAPPEPRKPPPKYRLTTATLQGLQAPQRPPSRQRNPPPSLPTRAPFMPNRPATPRWSDKLAASSDESVVYDLFAPNLQRTDADLEQQRKPILGVLNFAA